jgi:hypothetical protein
VKYLCLVFLIGLSGSAYAATGTSPPGDVPITIAGATPPAQAIAAGFTTPVINSDFTSAAYSNTSTWLDCAGASNPIWWLGNGFPPPPQAICPTITTDGGSQVLQMVWPTTGNNTAGTGITSGFPPSSGPQLPASSFYLEGVMRWVNVANAFAQAPWIALWNGCSIEFDTYENTSGTGGPGYYGDSIMHYCGQSAKAIWSAPGQTTPPNYPGFDIGQYHTYGARVTTDASTGIYFCEWIDNRLQGCTTIAPNDPAGVTSAMITTTPGLVNFIGGGVGNQNGTSVPSNFIEYVKRLTIWSCPNWQSANQVACKTSVLDPGGY